MHTSLVKKRLSKTKLVGRILALLPSARCVALNGSLASGNHKESSDIDILIIAKSGRIFTCRFFVNLFATIFGIKRSKDELQSHAGKFCFNYFLTENFLKIPTGRGELMDRYCAENYSRSKFIAGNIGLFEKFMRANKKLFDIYNCHPRPALGSAHVLSAVERDWGHAIESKHGNPYARACQSPCFTNSKLQVVQKLFEFLLGNWFERKTKYWQIKKIESDPRTKKYPKLIVFNNKELRFHPPSQKLRRASPPKG